MVVWLARLSLANTWPPSKLGQIDDMWRWGWLGHVLRMSVDGLPRQALGLLQSAAATDP